MIGNENSSNTNVFASLVRQAVRENWCMKLFCTTCGAMRFRDELNLIGIERIIDSMYLLTEEEMEELLEVSGDPVGIIERHAGFLFQGKNLWREEKPSIILKREAMIQAELQRKHEKKQKIAEAEEKNKIDRQEKKSLEYDRSQIQRQVANQRREIILARFSELNLQEKLKMIAYDTQHLPDYYPLQLKLVSSADLQDISSEVIEKLLDRLSLIKSNRWNGVKEKLSDAIVWNEGNSSRKDG